MAFEIETIDPATFDQYFTPEIIHAGREAHLNIPNHLLEAVRKGSPYHKWAIDRERGWVTKTFSNADRLYGATAYMMITLTGDYCVYRYPAEGDDDVEDASVLSVDSHSTYFERHHEEFISAAVEAFKVGGQMLTGNRNDKGELTLPFDHKLIFNYQSMK